MSVGLRDSTALDPGVPRPLFLVRDVVAVAPHPSAYDVRGDGERFLVRMTTDELQTRPLSVLVNWSVPARAAK
jgi:hypothetical protein